MNGLLQSQDCAVGKPHAIAFTSVPGSQCNQWKDVSRSMLMSLIRAKKFGSKDFFRYISVRQILESLTVDLQSIY